MQLRNAPTKAMKEWGYGANYEHAHQNPDGLSNMECLPAALKGTQFYKPTHRGIEARIAERMREIEEWRAKNSSSE